VLTTSNDDELDLQNGGNIAQAVNRMSNTLGTLAVTNFERAKADADRLRLPGGQTQGIPRHGAAIDLGSVKIGPIGLIGTYYSPNAAYLNTLKR
jgi:hypothetical protein